MALIGAWTSVDAQVAKSSANREIGRLRVPNGGLQPQVVGDAQGVIHLVYLLGEPSGADVY